MDSLIERVAECIQRRRLFRHGQRILVAVSGGVDSMVLLHIMHALAKRHKWRLTVAHFNHRLRGRSSDADERLVKRTAEKLGLAFVTGSGAVRRHAKCRKLSLEMAARELRHYFLARTARQLRIPTIALGHHADDQVELLFLRVLRGTGGAGLAGMKWTNPSPACPSVQLARPLLEVEKAELVSYARTAGIKFREDASNFCTEIQRNLIREELIPLLRKNYQPCLGKIVLRVMDVVGAESEWAQDCARRWLRQKRRTPFARLAVAVQRQCVRLQLLKLGFEADFDSIERLRLEADCPVMLAGNVEVFRDAVGIVQKHQRAQVTTATQLSAEAAPQSLRLHILHPSGSAVFDGVKISWRLIHRRGTQLGKHKSGREFFDADAVGPELILRHWQAGDRFQPIGMRNPVKLQDFFTNLKIPKPVRHRLVLGLTANGEVFWVEGLRIGERFKLSDRTTRRLEWTWQRVA